MQLIRRATAMRRALDDILPPQSREAATTTAMTKRKQKFPSKKKGKRRKFKRGALWSSMISMILGRATAL
jgi:hypothetical protein